MNKSLELVTLDSLENLIFYKENENEERIDPESTAYVCCDDHAASSVRCAIRSRRIRYFEMSLHSPDLEM
jgi:hypothetical protein